MAKPEMFCRLSDLSGVGVEATRLSEGFNGGLIFQASLRVAVCKGFLTSLFPDTGSAQLINISLFSDSALTDRPTVSQPHPPSLT